MSLLFTYKWQTQPYKPWKGVSTNGVVPGYSRGGINGPNRAIFDNTGELISVAGTDPHDFIGPAFKARPIKHFRKKLAPNPNSGSGKAYVSQIMDTPGGSTYLGIQHDSTGQSVPNCHYCYDSESIPIGIKNIIPTSKNNIIRKLPSDSFFDSPLLSQNPNASCWQQQKNNPTYTTICVACNPENNIIKSGVSLLNKRYYSNSQAYLYSRCKTYNQKLSVNKRPGNTYFDSTGTLLWPNNDPKGPTVFNTQNCPKNCAPAYSTDGSCCTVENSTNCPPSTVATIYKPNNRQFAQQGAVSGGTRLLKLKYDTITKNGNSFRSAFGAQGANAGKYQGTSTGPYFLKSKIGPCIDRKRARGTNQSGSNLLFSRANGNHTNCFHTPISSTVRQNKTNNIVFARTGSCQP